MKGCGEKPTRDLRLPAQLDDRHRQMRAQLPRPTDPGAQDCGAGVLCVLTKFTKDTIHPQRVNCVSEPSKFMGKEISQKGLKMKMNSASKLQERITTTKRSLEQAKPRSQRRVELELQLRDLMTKLLRSEIRINKRAA